MVDSESIRSGSVLVQLIHPRQAIPSAGGLYLKKKQSLHLNFAVTIPTFLFFLSLCR